jgi:hypothetical protein
MFDNRQKKKKKSGKKKSKSKNRIDKKKMKLIILFALVACVMLTSAAPPPKNAVWPQQFISLWQQFITGNEAAHPPYESGTPPEPYETYLGFTAYDWPHKRQFQSFNSRAFAGFGCPYSGVTCQMLNANDTAWAWTLEGPDAGKCCIEQRVGVLAPNFIDGLTQRPDAMIKLPTQGAEKHEALVYETPDGRFGYSFYKNLTLPGGTLRPALHYGHQFLELTGWRTQSYLYWNVFSTEAERQQGSPNPPPPVNFEQYFVLPEICDGAKECPPRRYNPL